MTLAAPGSGNGEDGAEHAVSAAAVRAAVDRIVNNPDFTASDRARNFLRYVVEETLNDRADRIKAFSVAVEVFGRDETFDAQNDPVVRIEAGRLRRALERYYLLSGKDDPIVIEIPKGGYVPVFTSNPTPTVPEAPAALPDPAEPEIGQPPASPGKSRARWIAAGAGVALAVVLAIGIGLYATGMLGGRHAGSPPEGPVSSSFPSPTSATARCRRSIRPRSPTRSSRSSRGSRRSPSSAFRPPAPSAMTPT